MEIGATRWFIATAGYNHVLTALPVSVRPFVELQCYTGGQPRYHLLVGVE